jgi:adenylate kinase
MVIVLLGAPGSGKGTLSNFLVKQHNFKHISTGDLFRKNIKEGTTLGKKIQQIVTSGALVHDDITNEVMKQEILQLERKKQNYILDGYPRSYIQAKFLSTIIKPDLILLIEISKDLAKKRIVGRRSCPQCNAIYNIYFKKPKHDNVCDFDGATLTQRKDDNEEAFDNRFKIYEAMIVEMKKYYADNPNFKIVEATDNTDAINQQVEEWII